MRTSGISPIKHTHKAQAQSGFAQRKDAAGGGASGEGSSNPQRQDTFEHSARTPADMHSLLRYVEKDNETIREAAQHAQEGKEQAGMVPSVLGLQLRTAIGKLQRAGFRVDGVAHEHSRRVAKGRVVSQLPGPGGAAPEHLGVRLVINSGD